MLFVKECKKVLFSLTFLIYCIATLAMYFTQFGNDSREPLEKPVPGSAEYGTVAKESPEILMPAAAESLVMEYLSDSYSAYPYGFYKNVRLKEKDKKRMADIIAEVSGITAEELDSFEGFSQGGYYMDENGNMAYAEPNIPTVSIPEGLSYGRFRELMREADDIIGGGSRYGDSYIVDYFSRVPKTYEDALAEYEQFIDEDKITGAYARLYCDYMGIELAILPVFVAVSLAGMDKKARMEQLAFSRKITSAKLIFTRYLSLVTVLILPVAFTTVHAHLQIKSIYPDDQLDATAFLRYMVCWLLPNIMTASAVGMLLTELHSGLTAIFVQGAWWFSSVIAATDGLTGGIGKFTLVMRHNSLLGRDVFAAQWNSILFNRSFFTALSIALVSLTAFIYELKRRGVFNGFKIGLPNNKRKSEA